MTHITSLNSLRFLAFGAVYLFHSFPGLPYFKMGYLGVDFFFVLSSFLLTYLAYNELENNQYFSKWNFIIRRALRIMPLYFLILIFSFLILPVLMGQQQISLPENQWMYWFFLSNYETSDCLFPLKFLWSIAVEEQFYLLFVLLSFLLSKHIYVLTLSLMVVYLVFMFLAEQYTISTYSHTLAHLPNFMVGMLSGYFFYKKTDLKFAPIVLFLITFSGVFLLKNEILFNINISLFFASLIFLLIKYSSHFQNNLLFKTTEKLGVYTYGLYVYSGWVITLVAKGLHFQNDLLRFVVEFAILLILAFASYHLFEKKFLGLKRYFRK